MQREERKETGERLAIKAGKSERFKCVCMCVFFQNEIIKTASDLELSKDYTSLLIKSCMLKLFTFNTN